jgi:hypothetical protein
MGISTFFARRNSPEEVPETTRISEEPPKPMKTFLLRDDSRQNMSQHDNKITLVAWFVSN